MITAIVLVQTDVNRIPEVAADIAALDRVHEHDQLADVIADRISKVTGVSSTRTYLAFRAYSRHDLEAAFALGMDGD